MHRLHDACDASLTYSSLIRRIRELSAMAPFVAHVVGTWADTQASLSRALNVDRTASSTNSSFKNSQQILAKDFLMNQLF